MSGDMPYYGYREGSDSEGGTESDGGESDSEGGMSTESSVGQSLPFPGFVPVVLGYLTQETRPRSWCLKLITNPSDSEYEKLAPAAVKHTSKPRRPRTPSTTPKTPAKRARLPPPLTDVYSASMSPTPDIKDHDFQWVTKKAKKDVFGIIKSEEEASSSSSTASNASLISSFTTRVAGGQSRRTVTTEGDYFWELKLYNVSDVLHTPPQERYKKALAAVKLLCGEDCETWGALQELLTKTYHKFKKSEPTYFKNK